MERCWSTCANQTSITLSLNAFLVHSFTKASIAQLFNTLGCSNCNIRLSPKWWKGLAKIERRRRSWSFPSICPWNRRTSQITFCSTVLPQHYYPPPPFQTNPEKVRSFGCIGIWRLSIRLLLNLATQTTSGSQRKPGGVTAERRLSNVPPLIWNFKLNRLLCLVMKTWHCTVGGANFKSKYSHWTNFCT